MMRRIRIRFLGDRGLGCAKSLKVAQCFSLSMHFNNVGAALRRDKDEAQAEALSY